MESRVILANASGKELGYLEKIEADFEAGGKNDFEIRISVEDWNPNITFGCLLYIQETEFGGFVEEIESSTHENAIYVRGFTWRGLLTKKIIEPPSDSDYRYESGYVEDITRKLLKEFEIDGFFKVKNNAGDKQVWFHAFNRYATLLDGLERLLYSAGCKLVLKYTKPSPEQGYVELIIEKIKDYSSEMELSQDCALDFTANEKRNGVNHLICLGKGELKDRIVKHLYIQQDGSVGETKYYTGLEEITDVYDYSSATESELIQEGKKRIRELMNSKTFKPEIKEGIEQEFEIGDIIAGRDYITGITVSKQVIGKIYTYKDGQEKIDYKIKGDD